MTRTHRFLALALFATALSAQPRPAFEAASIRPSAPIDQATIMSMIRAGKMPLGAHISGTRAEYIYLDLETLLTYAYGVKRYQITAPGWMSSARFDIVAKLPEGSTKADASKMLQTLLEDRFKLVFHRTTEEHTVLAIVVAKGGPKLKASAGKPVAIDNDAPLKPGEINMDTPDGPTRGTIDPNTLSSIVDMGVKGKMAYKINQAAKTIHIDFMMTTLAGFADMTTQLLTQLGGINASRIVDATGIQGNYDASLDVSVAEMAALARTNGIEGEQNAPVPEAADPGSNGATLAQALQSMGLKLESRKAPVEQFIVDHIEKTPTDN